MKSISVIVPVYNSQATLKDLHRRLIQVLGPLADSFEVILVDDGSKDASWSEICALAKADGRVTGVQLSQNFGQHNALLCGIRRAGHEAIVTIDDDLQNPPEEIPRLIRELEKGFDVVYGTPEVEQHGFWRDVASQLTKMVLQKAMGAQTARHISAFRAFRGGLKDAFINYQGSFISIDVLLTWGTCRFTAIPVKHVPRAVGNSQYTLSKLVRHAFNMLTGFSTLPLQVASVVGFVLAFFGIGILVYVIGRYFILGSVVPGFVFLASIIAIFSGAQLFALGILGEYIARIHFRTMDKPAYHVRTTTPC